MELRNNSLYNEGKTYKIMTTLELDVAGEWRDDNVASSMPALGSANSPGKPIVLHEDSFNSFLWKDPPMRGPDSPPWRRSRMVHQSDSEASGLGLKLSSLASLPLAPISMLWE